MNLEPGMVKNNINKFAAIYRLIDIAVVQFFLYISTVIYNENYIPDYLVLSLVGSISFALFAESFSLYRSWRTGLFKQLMFYIFMSWGLAFVLILGYLFFTKVGQEYSRVILGMWFISTFFALLGWRSLFLHLLGKLRKRGYNTRNIAIFGLSEKGQRLAAEVLKNPEAGYRLTAFFDDREADRLDDHYRHLLQGSVDEGIQRAKSGEYDIIYIALPIKAQHRIQDMLFALGDTTANVHVVPDLFMYCLMHGEMSHVGNVQTISVYDSPIQGGGAVLKRLEDVVLPLLALAILAIPMALIALGVKLTSPGPVIFKQDRYGLNGRKIKVWKFRTMTVTENADKVTQATRNDARITAFGAFLRRTSLDELPQFINVLKGDMSVIGPRPHAVSHNEEYRKIVDYYMLRHKVKPGITGWAQVNGWRGETDSVDKMQKRIEYDLDYIRNWSLWMDFKIMIFTLIRGFTDKNAY